MLSMLPHEEELDEGNEADTVTLALKFVELCTGSTGEQDEPPFLFAFVLMMFRTGTDNFCPVVQLCSFLRTQAKASTNR